jgi:2-oxo-3-(phosphooxy)propyl 3-oxoalkanoate synthase
MPGENFYIKTRRGGNMDMDIVSAQEFNESRSIVCAEGFDEKMTTPYVRNFDADFIVNNKLNRQYSIVYHGSSLDGNTDNCLIPVKSRREIELLLLSLGKEASVRMDEQERRQCNIWDWLYGRTYTNIFNDLKWSYREEDEVLDLIGRIPLPKTLRNSFLKIDKDDPEPKRIDEAYVHKTNKENVLISKPYQYANMYYFNGFTKSPEFNIEHDSDHLEKIIIYEVARQAVAATTHLAGIPFDGPIIILKSSMNYKKFIVHDEPFLIHTIPVLKQRGGYHYTVYNIIQNGESCVTGYFACFRYKSKESYEKHRDSERIAEISNLKK